MRLDTVLYHLAESMVHTAFHIAPVMPDTSKRMLNQLNYQFSNEFKAQDLHWGLLPDKHQLGEAEILFPRLEAPAE